MCVYACVCVRERVFLCRERRRKKKREKSRNRDGYRVKTRAGKTRISGK